MGRIGVDLAPSHGWSENSFALIILFFSLSADSYARMRRTTLVGLGLKSRLLFVLPP